MGKTSKKSRKVNERERNKNGQMWRRRIENERIKREKETLEIRLTEIERRERKKGADESE